MNARKHRNRAFVFLAAVGVLAVIMLLAFALAGSTQFTLGVSGQALGEAHEDQLVQSALDYAVLLWKSGQLRTADQPVRVRVWSDHRKEKEFEAQVYVMAAKPDHKLYSFDVLRYRPGDVLVQIESAQLAKRYGMQHRVLLDNTAGGRRRALDVTDILGMRKP